MATKTQCRIGSDVDLLSRIQLQEVLRLLEESGPKSSVEFTAPPETTFLKESKAQPNTPSRVVLLMSGLVSGAYDALVLDATVAPTQPPVGLAISAITRRLTPYDALVCKDETILDELPERAVLAANGARREAQMRYYRPDLRIVQSRGSLDSLIQKVKGAKIDAAVVAAADMERLGKQECVVELLTTAVCVPAAGQGALVVLVRSGDQHFHDSVSRINDPTSHRELAAEWAFLDHMGVNGAAPVGVIASTEAKVVEMEGVLASMDGRERIQITVKGSPGHERELGRTLAEEILDAGGRDILQELHLA